MVKYPTQVFRSDPAIFPSKSNDQKLAGSYRRDVTTIDNRDVPVTSGGNDDFALSKERWFNTLLPAYRR